AAHGVPPALRVDRLDRLGDDSLLVIDYKTGEEQPFLDRNGEPTDLQLVVYAAALAEPVGGLANVQLRPSGIRYRAVGASVEWSQLEAAACQVRLGEWKRPVAGTIEALAVARDGRPAALSAVRHGGAGMRRRSGGASVEWGPLGRAPGQGRLGEWQRQGAGTTGAFAAGGVRVNVARPPDEARPLSLLSRV